jgi:2-isopropylmalate synthase
MEGARQVECTINGIGERAGNASLEEIVMALRTRGDFFKLATNIKTQQLYPTSRLVSNVTGMRVQRNKAIVGQNAFAHEAGIHQHGMIMHSETYEIMKPEDVGFSASNLVLGKHSGRHALRMRIEQMGYALEEKQLDTVFEDFKKLADKKKEIYDADIEALIEGRIHDGKGPWEVVALHTSGGTGTLPHAAISLQHKDGRKIEEASVGDGPVDALFKAIERITETHVTLRDYQVRSVTVGEDAQGEVSVDVEHNGKFYKAQAVSTDIIEASAHAFLDAINRIVSKRQSAHDTAEAMRQNVSAQPAV